MPDITLTFDNGPTPGVTGDVLDVLSASGILSTFFVVGTKLAEPGARQLAARAHEEGHWIGNHTWSHPAPFGEWPGDQDPADEILRTQQLLGDLAHPDRLFRTPAGGGHLDGRLLNARALECIREQAMTLVLWNAIPRDWDDPDNWVETALRQFRGIDWTLMVLHDMPTGAMRNLPRFIDAVLGAGGRFRQDFPPSCVPIRRGRVTGHIERYLNTARIEEDIR
jgi:peptidoglycan/xylan/chitin deacetylase (PgdA/CDA1 family)